MVTWKPDPSHSRPARQQDPSPAACPKPDGDRHLGSSETSHHGADLAQVADASFAAGEIEADESPDAVAARLRADQLVVEAILEEGLGRPRHQALHEALKEYAEPVLYQALLSGRIISICTKLLPKWKGSMAWLDFTEDDCEQFARDMMDRAWPGFSKAVFVTQKWSANWRSADEPDKQPASLTTYFVNACALQYPTLERKWRNNRRAQPAGLLPDLGASGTVRDPSEIVADHDEALRLLKSIPDRSIQKVLALRSIGYTAAEAAERVGLTEKAAEGRMGRIRKILKKTKGPVTGCFGLTGKAESRLGSDKEDVEKEEQGPVIGDGVTAMEDGGCSDAQQA
jgi:hypothetical protein